MSKLNTLLSKANQGDLNAQWELAVSYLNGDDGIQQSHPDAFKWMMKVAQSGYDVAQYNIGQFYYQGIATEVDLVEALKWLKLASDQDNAAAQNTIGWIFMSEEQFKDLDEAEKWLKASAAAGNQDAIDNLGDLQKMRLSESSGNADNGIKALSFDDLSLEYIIRWEPEGRGIKASVFYVESRDGDYLKLYGRYHGYEGGGSYAEDFFKLEFDEDGCLTNYYVCNSPDDENYYYEKCADEDSSEKLALYDRWAFKNINNAVSKWLEYDEGNDQFKVRESRLSDMETIDDDIYEVKSDDLDFDRLGDISSKWPLVMTWGDDEDNDESCNEDDEEGNGDDKHIFIAHVPVPGDCLDIIDEDPKEGLKELARTVSSFASSVAMRLDTHDIYFLYKDDGQSKYIPLSSCKDEDECAADFEYQVDLDHEISKLLSESGFFIAFSVEGKDHWDYNFLKLSSMFGEAAFSILGPHPEYDDIIQSSYENGEYEDGIMVSSGDEDFIGDKAINDIGLVRDDFDRSFYGCEDEEIDDDSDDEDGEVQIAKVFVVSFGVASQDQPDGDLIDQLSASVTIFEGENGLSYCFDPQDNEMKKLFWKSAAIETSTKNIASELEGATQKKFTSDLLAGLGTCGVDEDEDGLSEYIEQYGGKVLLTQDSASEKKYAGNLFCLVTTYSDVDVSINDGIATVNGTDEVDYREVSGYLDDGADMFAIYIQNAQLAN